MLPRRGLHRLRYQRRHLQKTYAFSELDGIISDQHATLELIGGLLMSSDEGLLPGCFQRAVSAGWLTIKSACSGDQDVVTTVDAPKWRRPMHLRLRTKMETAYAPEVTRQNGDAPNMLSLLYL